MIWNIVSDSSNDLLLPDHFLSDTGIRYTSIPFVISIDGKDFVDNNDIDLNTMINNMEQSREISRTACPSPQMWHDAFLQEGPVFALTISKNLSGSNNSAVAAVNMIKEEQPDKQIAILDSYSTGPALIMMTRFLEKKIAEGLPFDEIVTQVNAFIAKMETIFALCSFDNLVKNGRMNRVVGFIARTLGFWGLGKASPEGTIVITGKERSTKKVLASFIHSMSQAENLSQVVISHCQNPEMAERVKATILEHWPEVSVDVVPTRGLCSFYAERHGLIISYI